MRRIVIGDEAPKLAAISRISAAISESLDLDKVLSSALQEIGNLLGVSNGAIYLMEPDERLHIKKHWQLSDGFLEEKSVVALGDGCTGTAAQRGTIYAAYDHPDSKFVCEDAGRLLGLDCLVAAPLKTKGQVVGVIEYFAPTSRRLTLEEAAVLEAVSHQVGVAIENAILMKLQADWTSELERHISARTQQLIDTNNRLVEADRARADFIAYLSHEIRNPLSVMVGFSGLLLQTLAELTNEQRTQLQSIERSAESILGLLSDLLSVSRLEAGKMEMSYQSFSFTDLAENVLVALQPQAKDKGIKLASRAKTKAPIITSDPHKIEQVVLNLMTNAIKFTDTGEVELGWELKGKDHLYVWVQDTGPGIAAEEAKNIFSPYEQMSAGRDSRVGSGLGLYISKHLIELAGGHISFESTPGEGSIFHFMIPVEPDVAGGNGQHQQLRIN